MHAIDLCRPLPLLAGICGGGREGHNRSAPAVPSNEEVRDNVMAHGDVVTAVKEGKENDKHWQDIPYDIAHQILRRVGSLAGIVSFANVCRNWGTAARSSSYSFPRLTLPDGTFFSVPDNAAEHLSLPPGSTEARCCGSLGGGWLVLVRHCRSDRRDRARRGAPRRGCINGLCCCYLTNLFTKATLPLPELAALHHEIEASIFIDKIISTKAPDDADCVFAALIHGGDQEIIICRPGKGSCHAELSDNILDMVFCRDNKLYVLTQGEGLFMLGLGEDDRDGKPVVSAIEQVIDDSHYPSFPILDIYGSHIVEARYLRHYLVVSRGSLLMVRRWLGDPYKGNSGNGDRTLSFEVFKLGSGSSEWTEVKGLDGEALLVGKRGSVSISSSSCDGTRDDCIYFVYDAMAAKATVEDPFRDSGVYSLKDDTIMPFLRKVAPRRGRWFPTWV